MNKIELWQKVKNDEVYKIFDFENDGILLDI